MITAVIYDLFAFFLVAFAWRLALLVRRMPGAGPRRPRGGCDKPTASLAMSPGATRITAVTRRVEAYTNSSTAPGLESEVRAIPRTLDALSRRIGHGCSTAEMAAAGASGQLPWTAVSTDLDGRCFLSVMGGAPVNITHYEEDWGRSWR